MRIEYSRRFVSTPLYIQGPGAMLTLRQVSDSLGDHLLVITDPLLYNLQRNLFREALGTDAEVALLDGEITPRNLQPLLLTARGLKSNVVVGVGGGKAIDAAKAVAREVGARVITVPTIASNDAPTSGAIALYKDEDHSFFVESLGRSPDAVVVDTAVIANAPAHFLSCGIGDALAKSTEANSCARASAGRTPLGFAPLGIGSILANACRQILLRDSVDALEAVKCRTPTAALERVVEAVILLSGLGFENGGLCVAHAMTRGLMRLPRTARAAHGAHVGYGLLVQHALSGDAATARDDKALLRRVNLPTSLREFGPAPIDDSEYWELEKWAATGTQHLINFGRSLNPGELVNAMKLVESMN
jgi:glycerol dehydrogenase